MYLRPGEIAQWQSAYLACMGPWAQSPVLESKYTKIKCKMKIYISYSQKVSFSRCKEGLIENVHIFYTVFTILLAD